MLQFLISYDLKDTSPSPYSAVRDKMREAEWYAYINYPGGKKWPHLPNTTFVGWFGDMATAKTAFRTAVMKAEGVIGAKITVRKFIIAEYGAVYVESDENSDDA